MSLGHPVQGLCQHYHFQFLAHISREVDVVFVNHFDGTDVSLWNKNTQATIVS